MLPKTFYVFGFVVCGTSSIPSKVVKFTKRTRGKRVGTCLEGNFESELIGH